MLKVKLKTFLKNNLWHFLKLNRQKQLLKFSFMKWKLIAR